MKGLRVVGISEMAVSSDPNEVLVTYSLGSCVGVTFYDPTTKMGGMIHCMLPLSSQDAEKAKKTPAMYVDSGVTQLLTQLFEKGVERKNIICKVSGGGAPLDDHGVFKIGERNHAILRKILWKNSIIVKGELIGGKSAKTLYLYMNEGKTIVKENHGEEVEL